MSYFLSKGESSSRKNTDNSPNGKEYEKVILVLLAERGYKLSKDNDSQIRDFSIGREVGIGGDSKLGDIVLRYENRESTNNLIFVQIKHKQNDTLKLNYPVLFGSGCGNLGRDFKLRQYFISYLNIREELKTTESKELQKGKISYIAIFTNIGVDEMELKDKGITLKKAPDDIKTLFALKKSSFEGQEANHWYQLCIDDDVRDELTRTFNEYFNPLRIAKDLGKTQNLEKAKLHMIKEDDIKDFFNCFVLFVNQPNVTDLLKEISPKKEIFLQDTSVGEAIEKLHPKFRERIEKTLGIFKKSSNEEVWISGEQIVQFVQELQSVIDTCVMTFIYEERVLKYGRYKVDEYGKIKVGKLAGNLGPFLNNKKNKVFCIYTPTTLLTIVKVLQYLDNKKYRERYGQISLELGGLMEIRDRVEKAFRSENNNLLIIECRHTVNEQSVDELCRNYSGIIKESNGKKIIIICKQNESILAEKLRIYLKELKSDEIYVQKTDDVNLKDFEPSENPLENKVIVFQGEKEKISLDKLINLKDWHSFVDYLSEHEILNEVDIADIMVQILNNDAIEVGSKLPGTSCLEGAYAELFEKINLDSLLHKLLDAGNKPLNRRAEDVFSNIFEETYSDSTAQNLENVSNEIYIFDGMRGLNENEKKNKLIECLGLVNEQEMIENLFGDIGSDKKIQVTDDQFNDKKFKEICCDNPNRKIFWIYMKDKKNKLKFILKEIYNHDFYLKRNFKIPEKVVIKKDVRKQLVNECLSEQFIFQMEDQRDLEDQREFVELLSIKDVVELRQFQINCEKGKIKLCKIEVENIFEDCCKRNETVHWLKLEEGQIIWCKSNGSLNTLQLYIDHNQCRMSLVKEDDLFKEIKDRRVVILADEPGMGKTTTLTKLYELKNESGTFAETSWIIRINLKDHLQAIRDMELVNGNINLVSVVAFLSETNVKLSHSLSKTLLRIALANNKKFLKTLFLAFDGFDEILDPEDRNKIITLLKFLNEKTAAKLWITTRLHCKKDLENELLTFAVALDPMTNDMKELYVEKYLKDRLYLILCHDQFTEFFSNNNEIQKSKRIHNYTKIFIKKMKLIFKYDVSTFIGTPLQLYLMLEDSINHIKSWIENKNKNLSFDYLGNDEREIYKTFLERKYSVYYKKMGIKEGVRQKEDKFIFTQYSEDFSKSLILKSKPKKGLEKLKDIVLSAGIIKSNGSNIEFIHATFRDYFAAKVFVHWMKEVPKELPNSLEQEYVIKETLKKPDYQLIRTFINLKLKKIAESGLGLAKEVTQQYGKIVQKILTEEQSALIGEEETDDNNKKQTVMHIAIKEGNLYIACFMLNSLEGYPDVLKRFLFMRCEYGETALHLAIRRLDYNAVCALLDAAAKISESTLQEFLNILDGRKWNALDEALCTREVRIVKELLKRANNKLDLIMNEQKNTSSLTLACERGTEETIKALVQEFTHEPASLRQLLFSMKSRRSDRPLRKTIKRGKYASIQTLINAIKDVDDDNYTLKNMILNCM